MNNSGDIDKDTRQFLSCLTSLLTGCILGICVLLDYTSLNHTNAIGRHLLAWSRSCHELTEYYIKPISDSVVLSLSHFIVGAVLIMMLFNLWKIPNAIVKGIACFVSRITITDQRPMFHKGLNLIELVVMATIYAMMYVSLITGDIGVFPGSVLAEIQQPLTDSINPMFDLYPSWDVYPRQLLLYMCSFVLWTLWWTPLLLFVSPLLGHIVTSRRIHESI